MDMSVEQSAPATPARRFWRTWRREIIRGGVLFGLVVGTGLFIHRIRIHVPSPLGALGPFRDLTWGDGAVRFTVQLPRNVPIDASTVNGGLEIDGVSGPVEAATVNGRIAVNTSTGPVQATTVNGSIEANMQALTSGDVRLTTVNGSVSAGLPLKLNANVDAETVNGRVETDFPVKIMGKISPRHLRGTIGTIGTGGPTLKLVTVNGSITLHEANTNPNPHPAPDAPHRPHMRMPRMPRP